MNQVWFEEDDDSLREYRAQRVMRPWRMFYGLTNLELLFIENDFMAMSDLENILRHCPDLEVFHLFRYLDDAHENTYDEAFSTMIAAFCPKLKRFSFQANIYAVHDFTPFKVILAVK